MYFLIGGKLFYNVGLASALQQCESASYTHISSLGSLPPPPASHPSRSSQSTKLSSLYYSNFSPAVSFTHDCIHMSVLQKWLSQYLTDQADQETIKNCKDNEQSWFNGLHRIVSPAIGEHTLLSSTKSGLGLCHKASLRRFKNLSSLLHSLTCMLWNEKMWGGKEK